LKDAKTDPAPLADRFERPHQREKIVYPAA
jgi:hypothetical protein